MAALEINSALLRERIPTITLGASGVVGTAAATVDIVSNLGVTTSAAGLAFTLPNPTDTRSGRSVVVMNTGTNAFAMYGQTIQAGQYSEFIWGAEDTAWHAQAGSGAPAWDNPDGTPATQASGAINYMAGNVGIGTNTPAALLHTVKAGGNVARIESDGLYSGLVSYLPTSHFFSGVQDVDGVSRYNVVNNITATEALSVNAVTSNTGLKLPQAFNTLHVGEAFVPNTGGVRLPITSTSAAQTGQPIGVDANGDIVRLAATSFDATVSFSTATPTAGGVVFTPNTPASTTVLYVSSVDGSQWTYNGTTYVTAPVSNDWKITGNAGTVQATNFVGTTDNVGLSFRTANVIRQTITNTGNVGIGTTSPLFKLSNTASSILDGGPGLGTGTALSGIGWSISEAGYAVGIENISTSAFSNGLTVRTASVDPLTSILSVGSSNIRRMVVQGNGNVGIGTPTPATLFHVNGTSTFAGGATISGTPGATWISMPSVGLSGIGTTNAIWAANVLNTSNYFIGALAGDTAHRNLTGKLLFGNTTGAPAMAITGNNVGIGTLAPTQKLHVIGNILASGTITPSDKRLKSNIKAVTYGVSHLLKLKAVSYTKKFSLDKAEKGEVKEIGFIAQDLQKVLPELVSENGTDKLLSVNYTSLIPILVKAIQEQQKEIELLKSKIK